MGEFTNSATIDGFSVKLWRGERMCLIGMDVEEPEDDLVGFSIEVQSPGSSTFQPLRNRLNFSYDGGQKVNGSRNFPSSEAPFQKFRWIHSEHAPEPFKSEWSGGKGIHEHHKFVVTDFNLPTAKVFTGSSNLSSSGESKNGDNLVMIEDPRVATSYAIEALRVFDHLHFRSKMQSAAAPESLILAKPTAISREPAWFKPFYVLDSQAAADRKLFSH